MNNNNINKTNLNVNNPNNIYFSPGTRVIAKAAYNGSEPVLLIYGYSYSEKTTKVNYYNENTNVLEYLPSIEQTTDFFGIL